MSVIAGVKPHLIKPPPAAVKAQQFGRMTVGGAPGPDHLFAAERPAIGGKRARIGPEYRGVVAQYRVFCPQVTRPWRQGLVQRVRRVRGIRHFVILHGGVP